MHKFFSVSGQLVEVQRYINVPMRWCEQYPARERRELWLSTAAGNDIKLIVHSREMPARRGHQVTALLLGERLVGIFNMSTGRHTNYLRADPPLLWRRCDAVAIAALGTTGIVALASPAWPALLLSFPMAFLYMPVMIAARLTWRYRTRVQVDRALCIVKGREVAQPFLRRVK